MRMNLHLDGKRQIERTEFLDFSIRTILCINN
jgi:hypothetical protein